MNWPNQWYTGWLMYSLGCVSIFFWMLEVGWVGFICSHALEFRWLHHDERKFHNESVIRLKKKKRKTDIYKQAKPFNLLNLSIFIGKPLSDHQYNDKEISISVSPICRWEHYITSLFESDRGIHRSHSGDNTINSL